VLIVEQVRVAGEVAGRAHGLVDAPAEAVGHGLGLGSGVVQAGGPRAGQTGQRLLEVGPPHPRPLTELGEGSFELFEATMAPAHGREFVGEEDLAGEFVGLLLEIRHLATEGLRLLLRSLFHGHIPPPPLQDSVAATS